MRWFTFRGRPGRTEHGLDRWLRRGVLGAILSLSLEAMVAEGKTASEYFVHSLPGAPSGPLLKMHAGHIPVDPEHNGHLFFWHFENRHIAKRQRTVIWLNGGPGCSSEDGAVMEVGPYRLMDEGHLTYNDGAWDEFANLLFVDQPVGTGYSYVDSNSYLHELPEMADQFVIFLREFFALFPQYEHDDIYLAGESYAGQHIPYIARAILDRNQGEVKHPWKLAGLLIGNGWIAPTEQYLSYLPFAYKEKLVEGGSAVAKQLEAQQAICTSQLNAPGGTERVDISDCEQILQDILRLTQQDGDEQQACVNMYDVRLRDSYPSCGMNWPPDLESVTPYLRRPDVIKALHINSDKESGWVECSGAVSGNFQTRESKPSIDLMPGLLEQMPVILFSGEKDLICNHMGTEELIHNMKWNGGTGFEVSPGTWAPRRDWTFEGEPAGIYQEARNLTYILFYNSSHMVPFDYPRRTRDMLDRFLGVDIASIGGQPADSRIDGEKGLETSVGGHPNSTVAEEKEKEKLEQVKWDAYYKSGEVALVVVILIVGAGGWYVYRDRRRRAGYQGLWGGFGGASNGHVRFANGASRPGGREHARTGMGLESFRHKRHGPDVEAGDFDETELDDLHVHSPHDEDDTMEVERYSVGGASSDDEDMGNGGSRKDPGAGKASGR
ncbi:MAG: Cell death protease [Thelocarpon superellum]|nr:MAG: Cell death protease [Thelocarpon superellum]